MGNDAGAGNRDNSWRICWVCKGDFKRDPTNPSRVCQKPACQAADTAVKKRIGRGKKK
jgi:hypothetical protein